MHNAIPSLSGALCIYWNHFSICPKAHLTSKSQRPNLAETFTRKRRLLMVSLPACLGQLTPGHHRDCLSRVWDALPIVGMPRIKKGRRCHRSAGCLGLSYTVCSPSPHRHERDRQLKKTRWESDAKTFIQGNTTKYKHASWPVNDRSRPMDGSSSKSNRNLRPAF